MKGIITSLIILCTYFGFAQKDTFKAKVYTYSFNNRSYLHFEYEEVYNKEGRIIKRNYTDDETDEGFIPYDEYDYKDRLLTYLLSNYEPNEMEKISYSYNKQGKYIKQISSNFRLRPVNERTAKETVKGDSILSWKKHLEIFYKYDKNGNKILKTEKHIRMYGKVDIIKHSYAYDSINRLIEEREYRSKELTQLIKYEHNDTGYLCKYYHFLMYEYKPKPLEWQLKYGIPSIILFYTKKYDNTIVEVKSDITGYVKNETKTIYDDKGRIIEKVNNGYGRVWVYE